MERERSTLIELDIASTATKGPMNEPIDEFAGRLVPGLSRD